MVTTDISQLTAECNTWREQMRAYREEITHLKNQLRQIALNVTRYEHLQDVEHYEKTVGTKTTWVYFSDNWFES